MSKKSSLPFLLAVPIQNDADDDLVFVSCDAGGDGQRLRYFFVFSSLYGKAFTEAQRKKIQKTIRQIDKDVGCTTERITFGTSFFLTSVLWTPDLAVETYFRNVYVICSFPKPFLRYHYFVTNTHRPILKEINRYLQGISGPKNV